MSEIAFFNVNQRVRLELIRTASESGTTEGLIEFSSVPTQTEVALRIGTHREAVTCELRSLHAKGFITWDIDKHIIHNVNALIEYSENH